MTQQRQQTEQEQWEAWLAQEQQIKASRRKEAVVNPIIDIAEAAARWARK